MSAKSMTIRPVLNGFIVTVGCQTVVVTSTTRLAREIERYYNCPKEVEEEYLKDAVNKYIDQPIPAMQPAYISTGIGTIGLPDTPPGTLQSIGAR